MKHEQYKLKERIEQLRAMDASAFLALPATSFSVPPGAVQNENGHDESYPGAPVNGAAVCNEGERRRDEMLEIASKLEERYRTLLPSEKKSYFDQKKASRQGSVLIHPSTSQEESIANGRPSEATVPTKANTPLVLKIKVPKQSGFSRSASITPLPKSIMLPLSSPSKPQQSPAKPISRASSETESVESERPRKRVRPSHPDQAYSPSSTPEHVPRPSHPGPAPKPEPCVLMLAAIRTSSAPSARKTQRHVTAFGTKVPQEIEILRDFELPEWIVPPQPDSPDFMGHTPDTAVTAEE